MSDPTFPRARSGPIELRQVTPRHAQQLLALARVPDVSALLSWEPHESIEDSLGFIHDARELWHRRSAWLAGIFELEHDRLVGSIGIARIDHHEHRGEVGTWLGVEHQGRGFNLHAKAAAAAVGFGPLGLQRLEFLVRADNERSLHSMRRLPAIREEGTLAQRLWQGGVGYDCVLFALLAREHDQSSWPDVEIEEQP